MNFKKQAKQLELFLEDELSRKPPIVLLPNGSIAFSNFIIKKNNQEKWTIRRQGGYVLDFFNVKACALTAAKFYNSNNFKSYNELKILDNLYSKNNTDALFFKHKYQTTKDTELKDIFVARYIEAKDKATYAKSEIINKFNTLF